MSSTITAPPSPPVPYGQPFYVLVVEDDSGNGNGKPIVWQTSLPDGGTLDEVENLCLRIGSRYGHTWLARCEIVGEVEPATDTNRSALTHGCVPIDLLREIVYALELAGEHGQFIADGIEPTDDSRLAARMAAYIQGGLLGDADNARTLAGRLSAYIPQPAKEETR